MKPWITLNVADLDMRHHKTKEAALEYAIGEHNKPNSGHPAIRLYEAKDNKVEWVAVLHRDFGASDLYWVFL